MEIEKKYLLERIPHDLSGYKVHEIEQGYISTDPTIRLRRSNDDYILTIKGEGAMSREEYELPITREQFERLYKKVETNTIKKRRYIIPLEDGRNAELDVYEGSLEGLLTVEVEFQTVEEALSFVPPVWFGKDVTEDKRYKNSCLSIK